MKKKQLELEEAIKATLDENGHEIVSSVPMEPPLGFNEAPSMVDMVRNMVRSELLRKEVENVGAETFEEADDFDTPDDPPDPSAPYEEVFEPEPSRTPPEGGAPATEPTPPPAPATPPAPAPSPTVAPSKS